MLKGEQGAVLPLSVVLLRDVVWLFREVFLLFTEMVLMCREEL